MPIARLAAPLAVAAAAASRRRQPPPRPPAPRRAGAAPAAASALWDEAQEADLQEEWSAIAAVVTRETPDVLRGFSLRKDAAEAAAVPSTCTGEWVSGEAVLETLGSPCDTAILFRDTNSWCPYCERILIALYEKGIAFETCFIELGNKPDWYEEVVPTKLVPAIKFEDAKVVYESLAILREIEERYPDAKPLVPADEERREFVEEVIALGEDRESSFAAAGYKYILGGGFQGPRNEADLPQLFQAFKSALATVEEHLGRYDDGPYFAGSSFSLADVAFCPSMFRIAANMATFRGYDFKNDPQFPRVAEWFEAMSGRESVAAAIGDDSTHNLVAQKVFRVEASGGELQWPSSSGSTSCKLEAAGKLAMNWKNVVKKLLADNPSLGANEAETAIRLLALHLVDDPSKAAANLTATVKSALQDARKLVSAPRDMSAGAAREFRAAATVLLEHP